MNKILIIALLAILVVGVAIILIYMAPPKEPITENKITYKPLVIPQQNLPSCIEEGTRLPENLQIPCCAGLSEIVFSLVDSYGGCVAEEYPIGEHFCTACGNGKCDFRENQCSCPQDCVSSAGEIRAYLAPVNYIDKLLQTFSTYYPEKYAEFSSSGAEVLIWLRENDPALLRDLVASTDNPAGIDPYLKRWEVFSSVSESYAQQILQSAIGEELSNITITDSGIAWEGCALHGPEGNTTRTCCQIPKSYGPGSQLSCKLAG